MPHKRRKSRDAQNQPEAARTPQKPAAPAAPVPLFRRVLAGALALSALLCVAGALPIWPERYDVVLKAAVFVSALVTAYVAYDERRAGWAITLGLIAVGFNPFWPLGLSRGNWVVTYLVVAILLGAAAARFRRPPKGIFKLPSRIP